MVAAARRAEQALARHRADDAVIDLIHARIDIAIRVGKLADSSLVARRLGAMPVLTEWRLPDFVVYAVTPRKGEQPAKVRHALTLLADYVSTTASQPLH